jgi:magnesium chelatase family protein
LKYILSATANGYDATIVNVELSYLKGLPNFQIVGLPNSSIQESKERVKSALASCDFKFPSLKVTINLSPSDIVKDGTHFDLSIALLIFMYKEELSNELNIPKMNEFYIFGELGLDGAIKESSKIFSMILSLAKQGKIKKAIVPKSLGEKINIIPKLQVYICDTLSDAIKFFKGEKELKSYNTEDLPFDKISIKEEEYYFDKSFKLNFSDVKGQDIAKRTALISACGFHNILLEGSPGCGKSMIAKRMQHILPPLSLQEILDKVKLQSLDNHNISITATRTFRSPHNSSTSSSIFGGGSKTAQVGEIALANNGILFFDELPHFSKPILESMREPLEDYQVLISRVNYKIQYNANFLFIGAMNPCPCGNLLSKSKECRCNELEIQRYKNKLSQPFLDRIDLYVKMQEVSSQDISNITSEQIFKIVLSVFKIQKQRGQKVFNSRLDDTQIEIFCKLDKDAQSTLDIAIQNFSLSFRSIKKSIKIARTIADINNNTNITKSDILEALSYRNRS